LFDLLKQRRSLGNQQPVRQLQYSGFHGFMPSVFES
jgi:hypothetical protein